MKYGIVFCIMFAAGILLNFATTRSQLMVSMLITVVATPIMIGFMMPNPEFKTLAATILLLVIGVPAGYYVATLLRSRADGPWNR